MKCAEDTVNEQIKNGKNIYTYVPGEREEAGKFRLSVPKKICVVAQTTFNYNKFHNIVEILEKKGYNVSVADTIYNAAETLDDLRLDLPKAVRLVGITAGASTPK